MEQTGISIARHLSSAWILLLGFGLFSCENDPGKTQTGTSPAEVRAPITRPAFSADSAFVFIERQLSFGPRVPNSSAHIQCAKWLERQFAAYGATVIMQPTTVTAWNGDRLSIVNIIASYRPEAARRVMLSAHWDSRPFADQDDNPENHDDPVPAANDGASGVAVLLEIARQLQALPPTVGVDLMLWDAEDYGNPGSPDSYALGSQFWARNPHTPQYRAMFGINLDMVGAAGAEFPREGYSMLYASQVVQNVWDVARELGHGQYFVSRRHDAIVDDHLYINKIAQIPMADVIDIRSGSGFFDAWHTLEDNLSQIDKTTLQAVGETVLAVVYQAK